MVRELVPIDISDLPEVAELAEEVARTGRARVLRRADRDIAVISPAPAGRRSRARPVTQADIDVALAASWEGLVDGERLKRVLDEARGDDRPPVEI